MRSRSTGFTLIEIALVVAIVGLLLGIAMPSILRARAASQSKTCIQNLWQIEQAKEEYVMDAHLHSGSPVTADDIVPTYLTSLPACPAGGAYKINAADSVPTCSLGGAHSLSGTGAGSDWSESVSDGSHRRRQSEHWEFDRR